MNENEQNPENTPTTEGEPTVDTGVVETTKDMTEKVEEVAGEAEAKTEGVAGEITAATEEVKEAATSIEEVAASDAVVGPIEKAKNFLLRFKYTIVAGFLVIVALLAFAYLLEQKGRIHTGMFTGVDKILATYKAVAKVNGEKISQRDLDISMSQIKAGAEAQGTDVTDPKVVEQIQKQSLDMLVNTELLKQDAATRGITISEEDITARIETLKKDVGGEDVLKDRMKQFGVDEKTLRRDVKNELTIQALLDKEFEAKGIKITDEEIKAFYEQAGGEKAGLPKLAEVKDKIEQQLKGTKQQEVVTTLIDELRKKATIEVLI